MEALGLSKHCQKLQSPNPITTSLASILVGGILVSYFPQHLKIITRRSSEGLSPWWVLLGGLSSIAGIANILVLPGSRDDMACCRELSGGECAAALLGIVQIGGQWTCFMFIVILFLVLFPTGPEADTTSSNDRITSSAPPKRRDAIVVGATILLALITVGIVSTVFVFRAPNHLQPWANFLGVLSSSLAAVQYLPQIWYTWRLGDVKSLSVITMMIQVPGAFLFAFSLFLRVGREGWSTWLVYVVTGILQGILLGLAVSYFLADRKRRKEGFQDYDSAATQEEQTDGATDPTEYSPLLRNGNGSKGRPISGQRTASERQLGMLYQATPPEHDSQGSSSPEGEH